MGEVLIGIVLPVVVIMLCRINNIPHFRGKINSFEKFICFIGEIDLFCALFFLIEDTKRKPKLIKKPRLI